MVNTFFVCFTTRDTKNILNKRILQWKKVIFVFNLVAIKKITSFGDPETQDFYERGDIFTDG